MTRSKPQILISSCLIGLKVQWDEGTKPIQKLIEFVEQGRAIFICPEQSGGLPTPRDPSEIEFGKTAAEVLDGKAKVVSIKGKNVTKEFVKGAEMTLEMCNKFDIKYAILKAKSPSCGSILTYDGSFTGTKIRGYGVTAEFLIRNGINVYNEDNYFEIFDYLD